MESVGDILNRNSGRMSEFQTSSGTYAPMGWKKKANIKEVLLSKENKN